MKKKMINSMLLSGVLFCCFLLVMCKSTKETTTQVETTTQIAEPATPVALAQETKLVTTDTTKVEAPPQIVAENFIDSIKYRLTGYEYFYEIIDSLPDYVIRVLPNVEFYTRQRISLGNPTKYYVAHYEGVDYDPVGLFNRLMLKLNVLDNNTFNDKIKCILFFKFSNGFEIINTREEKGILSQYNIYYQYILQVKSEGIIYTLYVSINNNQIGRIFIYQDEVFKNVWNITTFKI